MLVIATCIVLDYSTVRLACTRNKQHRIDVDAAVDAFLGVVLPSSDMTTKESGIRDYTFDLSFNFKNCSVATQIPVHNLSKYNLNFSTSAPHFEPFLDGRIGANARRLAALFLSTWYPNFTVIH